MAILGINSLEFLGCFLNPFFQNKKDKAPAAKLFLIQPQVVFAFSSFSTLEVASASSVSTNIFFPGKNSGSDSAEGKGWFST